MRADAGHRPKAEELLVFGQVPPPVHGSNVMTALFLKTLSRLGAKIRFINKGASRRQEEVGKLSARKVLRLTMVAPRIALHTLLHRPALAVLLPAARMPGFLPDALLMFTLRALGIPYVLYFHGRGYQEMARSLALYRRLLDATVGRAKAGIVLGERLKDDVSTWITPDRLFVLPNAVPDIPTSLQRPRTRSTTSAETIPRLLFLSNLKPTKGAREFLLAAAHAVASGARARFVVAGSFATSDFGAELRSIAEQDPLRGLVEFPGALFGEEKHRAFQDADIFVFPTYYPVETFGLVNLEAMRASVPVIATSVGAIPEVVLDGKTGLIVPPRDVRALGHAMLKLIRDSDLRLAYGRAGRRRYEECYSVDAYRSNVLRWLEWLRERGVLRDHRR